MNARGDVPPTPTPPAIHYAPPPTLSPRWKRRFIVVLSVTAIALLALDYGPAIWDRTKLYYWQSRCLSDAPSSDAIVLENEPVAAQRLLKADGRYSSTLVEGPAYWFPNGWREFSQRIIPRRNVAALAFVGRRDAGEGARIVVIEGWIGSELRLGCYLQLVVTVIDPGTPFESPQEMASKGKIRPLDQQELPTLRVLAGRADPENPSHVELPYVMNGNSGAFDVWLKSDGSIRVEERARKTSASAP